MDKKKKLIIAGFIVLLVVMVMAMAMVIGPYVSKNLPFYIMGQSTPLFIINNKDVNNSHEVVIEIFNSDNESIFKELYNLNQNERVEYPKPPMMKNPKIVEEYTIKAVLDNDTMKLRRMKIDPWTTPVIDLYSPHNRNASGEVIPLYIRLTMI